MIVAASPRFPDSSLLVSALAAASLAMTAGCGGSVDAPAAPAEDASADAPPPEVDAGKPDTAPPPYLAVPLAACTPSSYTATVTIGGTQQFQLAIDTGSTTLGVASKNCSGCGVSPLYQPGPKAVDEGQMTDAQYGSGEWTGEIYQDSVAVGSEPGVPLKFGAIDMQSQFFNPVICTSKSGSMQGIIGFAPAATALPGTAGYFDQLVSTDTHVPNIFATELCETGGTLWLGGYDPTFTTAAPKYTSLSASEFAQYIYAVKLSTIAVAGTSIPVASAEYTDAIVDTGTSIFILPTAAFSALTTAIANTPAFTQIFDKPASWFSDSTSLANCVALTQTKAALDAALPALTLTVGASPSISIQAVATESYLISYDGRWCPALDTMDSSSDFPFVSILGSPILRSNIVIFDRAHKQIGFAPHKTCP